ncbi:Transcription factor bHLH35 [Bienertia sinuspersici]
MASFMDKASIIKDAISYIKELHEQEKRIKTDISDLEYRKSKNNSNDNSSSMMDYEQELPSLLIKTKKKRVDHRKQQHYDSYGCSRSTVRVSYVGEKTIVVSLTCSKREGTMVKLCEMFESLKLKIITAHITAFSGRLLKTVFLEADEREKDHLRIKIETVVSSSRS